MRFKLRQMEVFRAVMLAGSVSGAARMLFVSQPVVSRTLSHMEMSLGIALFDRKGGLLIPTDNAQIIFREVEEVYGSALRVDELVANLREMRKRKISFSSSPALGVSVIPIAIRKYRERFENARFSYKTTLIKDIPMDLLGKTVDFALSIWPIDHPNLQCETLFEGKIALIVPNGHALAGSEVVQLKQLAGVPIILYLQNMPIGAFIREALTNAGLEVSPVVEINRSELACALVHQGVGVALVNRFCVDENIWRGLTVKDIDIDIPASVCLVTSRFDVLSEDCHAFVESIRELYEGSC